MEKQNTFKSLISKTISGDIEAFEQLILSQMDSISFQIRGMNMIKNQADIEDISQDVAMRIYQNINSLKYPEAFTSWLRTIIVRECLRCREDGGDQLVYLEDIQAEVLFQETDETCLPSLYAERAEQSKEIIEAMKKLPEALRNMVAQYYCEEKSYKNIAEDMDVAIGNVSINLFRARRRLRKELRSS